MGNWRTVMIEGTCPPAEIPALNATLDLNDIMREDVEWLPLCYSHSMCGLGNWPRETIRAGGNLFERDFTVEDVADHLRKLSEAAPGLRVKVHCGDDWESKDCIATVTLDDNGVTVGDPEIGTVVGVSDDAMTDRLLGALFKP